MVVYEPSETAGGHAHTEYIDSDGGGLGCDCGFMVFNHQNYPNMVELFAELGVEDEVGVCVCCVCVCCVCVCCVCVCCVFAGIHLTKQANKPTHTHT